MNDKKKPHIINFTKPDETKAAVEALKRQLPTLKEYAKIMAEYRYCLFQEYVDAGFTVEQAVELCKASDF